ncbi:MAG: RidA family protein [Clostridiales bacterium]|jgi:enamine deaminase RidA (YjgF/YER057c/UK114 family)|nr:RidA family protein [Clostridiales bacterium]
MDIDKKQIELTARDIDIPYVDYTGRCLVAAREWNGFVYVSGTACEDQIDGHPIWTGAIGREVTFEEAYKAAQWCGLIQLSIIRNNYGLDRVDSVVRAFGLLQVADDFYDLDRAFDGYSDVMYAAFGERGRHVRTIMGTRNLPNHLVSIEVETIFKLKP